MLGSGDVPRLEHELQRMHAQLADWRASAASPLARALRREKHRAERYNHYFAVLVCSSDELDVRHLIELAGRCLRVSDVYAVLSEPSTAEPGEAHRPDSNRRLGIILPETDRAGAQAALRRLSSGLSDAEVTVRLAVYPDDGTTAHELLAAVAA